MGGGVGGPFTLVVAPRDNDTVGDHHGPDRDVPVGEGEPRLGDRQLHHGSVVKRRGWVHAASRQAAQLARVHSTVF